MKALRILNDLKVDICEAIEELEVLQNENKSLVKTLEKYKEEMIELRKENQELEILDIEVNDLKADNKDFSYTIIASRETILKVISK